jgi:hypothetical protein
VIVKFRQCYRLICYHKRDGYQNKKCYALYWCHKPHFFHIK